MKIGKRQPEEERFPPAAAIVLQKRHRREPVPFSGGFPHLDLHGMGTLTGAAR
jgi:hypothetical protein